MMVILCLKNEGQALALLGKKPVTQRKKQHEKCIYYITGKVLINN